MYFTCTIYDIVLPNKYLSIYALFYMDLNNRRTGKDATKPRALGLLGHSEHRIFIHVARMSLMTLSLFVD